MLAVEIFYIAEKIMPPPVLHKNHLTRRNVKKVGKSSEMIPPDVHDNRLRVNHIRLGEIQLFSRGCNIVNFQPRP